MSSAGYNNETNAKSPPETKHVTSSNEASAPINQAGKVEEEKNDVVSGAIADLPFLVTHWLDGFSSVNNTRGDNAEAIQKIKKATADLASAFSNLGVFGMNARTSLSFERQASSLTLQESNNLRPKTYSDLKRQWSRTCPPEQLESLVRAAISAGNAADAAMEQDKSLSRTNLTAAASEWHLSAIKNPKAGRTLQDAIDLEDPNNNKHNESDGDMVSTFLHPPVLMLAEDRDPAGGEKTPDSKTLQSDQTSKSCSIMVRSSYKDVVNSAASEFRRYLDLRKKYQTDDAQIGSIRRSLELHKKSLEDFRKQRNDILLKQSKLSSSDTDGPEKNTTDIKTNGSSNADSEIKKLKALDEIENGEQNCERVIAQLERQLPGLEETHSSDAKELALMRDKATKSYNRSKNILGNYRDPVGRTNGKEKFSNNRILFNIYSRTTGMDRFGGRTIPRAMGRIRPFVSVTENRKSLLYNRFSHAATINTHLHYPVYCLRFDLTGRYFITGADDYLVRVFCVGDSVESNAGRGVDPSSYVRGAVLVCTLKGHAGVINDICVSADNSFLATASEDGDCRVWGLRDGCPVAILRGHEGGANMVSWSALTPYRLVTTSADGLARTWDIREACLKRYGSIIGKRPEYSLKINGKKVKDTKNAEKGDEKKEDASRRHGVQDGVALPPLPARNADEAPEVDRPDQPLIPLPLLPLGENESNDGLLDNVVPENEQPGQFVANDLIDEGVKLLSKLQHGASLDERANAPGTRARRAAVKVICVARCPFGGHFATGSDDGICRIWKDDDDSLVDKIDAELCNRKYSSFRHRHSKRKSTDRLLLTLKGHLSAITDLVYSSKGDRILTASQKDGIVRVWSWNQDPCKNAKVAGPGSPPRGVPGGNVSNILIKLTNPRMGSSFGATSHRKRLNRISSQTISCDVAAWIQDDSMIVTSQSELVKANGSEIVPGSHYIFLWDSCTGNCLLGLSGAHTKQCPVLISHPTDPSILCSAGADGIVNLWDLDAGKCFFSHANTADFGPIEPNERGKNLGYLDGAFSPDGTSLVLTDDTGRVTVFDCHENRGLNEGMLSTCPAWMKEQYFSNDYYDLRYDTNGYCTERGSEQPPHLAPKGSRCSHTGAPFSEQLTESFLHLTGPIPLEENAARWHREEARRQADALGDLSRGMKGSLQCQYDPKATILIENGEIKSLLNSDESKLINDTSSENRPTSSASTIRRLSSNWRWGDAYADSIREGDEEIEVDSDDEEFELNDGRRGAAGQEAIAEDEDGNDFLEETDEDLSPVRQRSRSASNEAAPTRVSSRRSRRRLEDSGEDEDVDDDDDLLEFMSTNNVPSGPYAIDYDKFIFRLPEKHIFNIARCWVHRNESTSSYDGRKKYSPQMGDAVVYIPRAHFDTISQFPNLEIPWQNWPGAAVWPVVECQIRNIRYRFPFEEYFNHNVTGQTCKSIVAVLTLEITGVPELLFERISPWPNPSFLPPAEKHVFEISVFENDQAEFIIPSALYKSRLTQVDSVFPLTGIDRKPKIEAFYKEVSIQGEDAEFVAWTGNIIGLNEQEPDISDPSLLGSGYNMVKVQWEDGEEDLVSPWEINVKSSKISDQSRPALSDSEKRKVREAIKQIKNMPSVEEYFMYPVNENRYSDYQARVEFPIDLTFMMNRLDADYYSTVFSVVADVRQILNNCVKYNGEVDDLSDVARSMYETFEEILLSPEERDFFREYDYPMATGNQSRVTFQEPTSDVVSQSQIRTRSTGTIVARNQESQTRRRTASRRQTQSRSSLEALPRPSGQNRTTRRVASRRGARSNQRGIETLHRPAARTLEQISSTRRGPVRGRSNGNSGGAGRGRGRMRSRTSQAREANEPLNQSQLAADTRSQSQRRRSEVNQAGSSRMALRSSEQPESEGLSPSNGDDATSFASHIQSPRTRSRRPQIPVLSDQTGADETRSAALRNRSSCVQPDFPAESGSETLHGRRTRSAGAPRNNSDEEASSDDNPEGLGTESDENESDTDTKKPARRKRTVRRASEDIDSEGSDSNDRKPPARPRRRQASLNDRKNQDSESDAEQPKRRSRRNKAKDIDSDSEISESEGKGGRVAWQAKRKRNGKRLNEASSDEQDSEADVSEKEESVENSDSDEQSSEGKSDSLEEEGSKRKVTLRISRRLSPKEAGSIDEEPDDGHVEYGQNNGDSSEQSSEEESGALEKKAKKRKITLRVSRSRRPTSGSNEENDNRATRSKRPTRKPFQEMNEDEPIGRAPPRRARATTVVESYVDPSSSEFESCIGDSSEDDSFSEGRPRRKTARIASTPATKRPNGKRKAHPKTSRSKKKKTFHVDEDGIPTIDEWPEIKPRLIPQVTKSMLEILGDMDDEDIFAIPVVESYPNFAVKYNEQIKTPMDFRTILNERVQYYRSIKDLRRDLMLVFGNCIKWTGQKSKYGQLAKKMIMLLPKLFKEICEKHYVVLSEE